ncbi:MULTISPECIES: GNAT family N-acetyltransferase [Sphingobacterium]|uniref:GNAT family N-acetyltransferase n=1 Tax=Sphingobacterium TaxID=28453 RepID=UPI00257C6BC2|nr:MULTISPECIES: GNAT family N-acetyltransferase [Sphingobacterium]
MNIRKAVQADLPKIKNLYFQLFEQMANHEPGYMQTAHQDESFLQRVIAGEDQFTAFVYRADDEVKGIVITQLQKSPPYNCFVPLRCMYLMDIVVDADMRGMGIGKALINRVKMCAKENQADYLELSVLSKNLSAAALYLHEGFEPYSICMRLKIE